MARIPEEAIDRVKKSTDLAALVRSRGIDLKPHGTNNLIGCCPFHDDKEPSFVVTPNKGLYHCLGCGAAGNPIQFVEKFDGVSFRHAFELLADGGGAVFKPSGTKRIKQATIPRLELPINPESSDDELLLQIMEFYLVLSVDQDVPQSLLATLLGASVIMILFGFLGETGRIPKSVGFGIGMIAWGYIVYEVFFGTGAKFEQESKDKSVKMAFNAMRWIVTVGWAIYPIGYLVGNTKTMNIIYNLGDFVNKIAFTGAIWYAASIDDTDK